MEALLESYELGDALGRGAQGAVFRARHRITGAVRAVKVLEGDLDPESVERFRREAQALARAGDAAVTVHEVGAEPGRVWFAMELCPGGSLRAKLRARGRFGWREAVALVARLARGLDRCHELGLVHRDLKPENILFDEKEEPRIADWGLVHDLGRSRLTETGATLGTPAYMPLEQLEGKPVSGRADVFALGVILHELVAGTRPFEGPTSHAIAQAIRSSRREPVAKLGAPAALDALLDRALAAQSEARTASARRLADELDAVASKGHGGGARRTAPIGLAVAVAVVIAAVLAALHLSHHPSPPSSGPAPPKDAAARVREALSAPGAVSSRDAPWDVVKTREELVERAAQRRVVYSVDDVAASASASGARATLYALALLERGARPEALKILREPRMGPLGPSLADTVEAADWFGANYEKVEEIPKWQSHEFLKWSERLTGAVTRLAREPPELFELLLEPVTEATRKAAYSADCSNGDRSSIHFVKEIFASWSDDNTRRIPPRLFAALVALGEAEHTHASLRAQPGDDVLERAHRILHGVGEQDPVLAAAALRVLALWSFGWSRRERLAGHLSMLDAVFAEIEGLVSRPPDPRYVYDTAWRGLVRYGIEDARGQFHLRLAQVNLGGPDEAARAIESFGKAFDMARRGDEAYGDKRAESARNVARAHLFVRPDRIEPGVIDDSVVEAMGNHPLRAEVVRRQGRAQEALGILTPSARAELEAETGGPWVPAFHAVRALALADLDRMGEARDERREVADLARIGIPGVAEHLRDRFDGVR